MTGNVTEQISKFFDDVCAKAAEAGINKKMIIVDPGIGFGKTSQQNVDIISSLRQLKKDHPLLIGTSMKSFLRDAYPGRSREDASILSALECINNGADIVRMHDVKRMVRALK
jgi:dihydropteroate synthase